MWIILLLCAYAVWRMALANTKTELENEAERTRRREAREKIIDERTRRKNVG
jgi:hypothetical protein